MAFQHDGAEQMRLTRRALLAGFASLPVIAHFPAARAGEINLRLAHPYPEAWPVHQSLAAARDVLLEQTDWLISLEIFPAGQLGRGLDLIPQLVKGPVQLALLPAWALGELGAGLEALDLPGVFQDYYHWQRFSGSEAEQIVAERLRERELELIGSTWIGSDHIISREPISSPGDLSGTKLRLPSGPPAVLAGYEELGVTPVQIPFHEVFTALQAGVVDGAVATMPWASDAGILETGEAIQRLPVGGVTAWLVASPDMRRELGDFEIDILRTVLRDALNEAAEASQSLVDQSLDKAAGMGIDITSFDQAEWDTVRARMSDRMSSELPEEGRELAAMIRDLQ
jgi:C4-dicarboxylate-binding protein DctP